MMPSLYICPECNTVHRLPKNGPYDECCLRNMLSDMANEVATEFDNPDPADWWKRDEDDQRER